MRSLLPVFLLASAVVCYPQQPPATPSSQRPSPLEEEKELCKLEGRAVHALTGEPVRRVNLTLRGRDPESASRPVSASTDADGRFSFEKVEPGTYWLVAERAGFLRQSYGSRSLTSRGSGTPLNLLPGQHLKDLEFKLMPQGVIAGKVLDEEGEPVQQAAVNASRQTAFGGRTRTSGAGSEMTNDLGEFRLANLSPGRYIVSARHRGGFLGGPVVQSAGEGPEESYVLTYYPSSTDPAGAVPVEVGPGQEVPGINIILRKGRVFRVEGKIVGLAPGQERNISLTVRPRREEMGSIGAILSVSFGRRVNPDGSFEIVNVRPGPYHLIALSRADGRPQPVGRVSVDVVSSDVTGVLLPLAENLQLTGTVRVEGQEKISLQTLRIRLSSAEGLPFSGMPPSLKDDGTFKIESVFPDKYHLYFYSLPENTYVKSLRMGTQEVLDKGLDLANASSSVAIEVLLSPKAAVVEGLVREDDKPAPGRPVTLVPDPFRPAQRYLLKQSVSDQNGRFSIKGVAPGKYKLYAWTERPPYNLASEPELLKPFESKGVDVSVEEDGRAQAELTALDPEEAPQE